MSSRNRWINRLAKRSVVASAAAAAASTLLSTSAFAITGTWITTSSSAYGAPGAWIFANIPGGASDIANFTLVDLSPGFAQNPNAVQTLHVDLQATQVTLGQLVFADTNTATPGIWSLESTGNNGTLVLNNGASAVGIINVGNLGNLATASFVQIDVPIRIASGAAGGLVKTGAGELRLLRTNDFGGGTLSVNGGTLSVGQIAQIGNIASTISMGGGTLSLRRDTVFDLSNYQLNVTANSGLNIDRAIGSSLTGQSVTDLVGTVALTGSGVRLSVTGSTNGYGLNIGTLIFQGGGSSFFTDLAPSAVTIGNVTAPSGGTLTFSGTGDASGSDLTITNSISQTGTSALSIAYTDSHTLTVGSFGATAPAGALTISGDGTLLATGAGVLLPSATLTISSGTLNFENATGQSTVGTILLGTGGSTASYIKMGPGGLKLNTNLTFSAGSSTNPAAPALITGASGATFALNGAVTQTFNIGQILTTTGAPGRDVVIDVPVSGTGTVNKTGAGELVLKGANAFNGTANVSAGTLTSIARASGSALAANNASGTLIIQSGNFRLLSDDATGGSAAVGTMKFTGDTAPAKLIVDASGAGVGDATLSLGTFGTRVSGTGVLTIIPQKTTLDTNEHINVLAFDPQTDPNNNHTIIAPFVVTQKSGTNPALDFVSRNGSNNLVTATYANFTGSETGGSIVAQVNGTGSVPTAASLFALRVDAGESVTGGGVLTLGDGTRAGLILNDGAVISVTGLAFNAPEAVIWSGGTSTGGTVSSNFVLSNPVNNLTTGGPQVLTFSGTVGLGAASRTISVGSGTTVLAGDVSNGSIFKTGPGVLALTSANAGLNGTVTVNAGTVSVGVGSDGSLGTASVNTGVAGVGVGTLQFNLSGFRTITNFMTGAGTILQNSSTDGTLVLHSSTPSTYSNLAILRGGIVLDANDNIPTGATISVSGGSLDLNGFNQTANALAGGRTSTSTGLITNSSSLVRTLTINPTSTTNATYSGNITGSTAMRIVKTGNGTQGLSGNNDYIGGTTITTGTLTAASNGALGHDASIVLNSSGVVNTTNPAILRLDPSAGPTLPASLSLSIGTGIGTVSVGTINGGVNAGTISGPIVGTGTFVINNQDSNSQLTVGSTSLDGMYDPNTLAAGTVQLTNGGIRFNAAAGANVGNPSLNFNLQGTGQISTVAAATVRLGNIIGGTNTTITAVGGSVIQLGAAGGAQQFGGTITGNVTLSKVGNGTLTLNNRTSNYSGVTNVLGGALVLNSAILSGTPTINIVGGPFVVTGAASISSAAVINLNESFAFDVTSHQGWTTPGNLTVQGTGQIAGKYTHNAGTLLPGTDGTMGSITFNTFDTRNQLFLGDATASAPGAAGVTLLDFTSVGVIGAGSNDLIVVNGDIGLNNNALFRVNNLNPITNFLANQTYPAILYSGTKLNGLAGTVSSSFRGSFALVDVPDNVNFPGFHVIGVKVVSFNTAASVSTWTGTISSTWDLNITKNFVNAAEGQTTFFQGDSVVFNNSVLGATPVAGNRSVNLSNGLILPGTLTFGNTSNLLSYTVNGPGIIGGGARVLINGGGTVSITGNGNTYTGGTVVNSGWLVTGGNTGNINNNGNFGIGSVLLNGGASGQSATLVFAANGNVASDIYTPSGQMANFVGLGSLGTNGKMFGTFNLVNTPQRWDLGTLLQLPTDPATGTILINTPATIRLMRPYAGAGLFFNFASGQGGIATNLFDPMNDSVFLGGLSGVGAGNLTGFTGGNAAWYKAFIIGGANADSTWGGSVTDSFGRNPANGGGQNAAGISNSHAPTAITKVGTKTLKLNGQTILMSGDLTVNQGTMIIDSTDGIVGTREGGGLFQWASRVQVNSGATFQMGSGGYDGLNNYMGDGNSNAGTFVQASSTGFGVSWNANNATINVSKGYTSLGFGATTTNNFTPVNFNSQYAVDPNLTVSGSSSKIYGAVRLSGGTLSPGDGGSGRIGPMSIFGTSNASMEDPNDPIDIPTSSPALSLTGGALVFDVGTTTANADTIAVAAGGTLTHVGNGTFQIVANSNSKIVVNFNGNSAAAGSKYTLMTYSGLNGTTFQGANGPQLILNGRNATGTLVANGATQMQLSITTAASASNIEWSSSSGTWDVASWATGATRNWKNLDTASSADYFYNGDSITFNPNAVPGGTVLIGGSVAPAKITVETNLGASDVVAYTFAGKGRITGNGVLVKNGNGTLSVRTKNDFSGGTSINAGTLEMGTSPGAFYFPGMNISATGLFFDADREGDLGTGTITIASGATLAYRATRGGHMTNNIVGAGNFVVDVMQGAIRFDTAGSWTGGTTVRNGYLSLGVNNAIPSTGSLNILTIVHPTTTAQPGAGGRFDLNEHSQSINELYGNGAFSLVMNEGSLNLSNPQTTFSVGSGNFMGAVHQGQEGNPQGSFAQIAFVKFSSGTLTMNYLTNPISAGGTLTTNISGLSDVKQGTLVVRGIHEPNGVPALTNTQTGSYVVRNGATLAGDATIRSLISVESSGILAPGLPDASVHTGGTLTVNGLALTSSVLNFDLRGIDNDQVDIQTNNTLNALGVSTININVDNTLVTQPGTYKLIDYRGTPLQNFTGKFTKGTITNPGIFSYNLVHNTALTEIDLVVSQPTVTSTWNVSTGGSWAVANNWTSVGTLLLAPNSVDSVANLTAPASMSVDPTITVDNTIALATLNLSTANGHSFTINKVANGSFNFNTSGANAVAINVTSGNHAINVPTTFNQDPTITVATGSTLSLQQSLDAAGQNVTKTGAGMLVVGNVRNTSGFDGSANFRIANGTVKIAHFAPSNLVNGASKVNTLSIDSTGTLDITNNAIVLDYASAGTGTSLLSSTRGLIVNGKIKSTEPDPTSTHAIGYRDNQGTPMNVKDPATSTGTYRSLGSVSDQGGAGGVSVDPTSIIVKYTYKGDTNLDGAVDLADLLNVATHFNQTAPGGDGWLWQQGDFNYDGIVNTTDLQYIGTNWLLGTGSNPGTQLSPLLTALGLPNVAVPEPTSLGLVGIGLTGLMARRRRRQS